MFGQMAEETLLTSQRVIPRRLQEAGFRFRFPDVEQALRHELARE
jgi:NAD dependent epimerase/dehydratase family enzyme